MSYFDKDQVGKNAFGIVTVMDVDVYDCNAAVDALIASSNNPAAFLAGLTAGGAGAQTPIAKIDHMQVATLSTEGPSITINGGKYNNPLVKYGKTARCEMTDALGQADALVALGGAEYNMEDGSLSITDKFGSPKTLIGNTFVVDQKSGKHVPVRIIIYKFLPDSTPSFAFDSGNAATFDLNGDLLAVELGGPENVQAGQPCGDGNGVFFSMLPIECTLPSQTVGVVTYHRSLVLVQGAQPSAAELDEFQFGKENDILIINNSYTYKKDDEGVWQPVA